LLGKEHDTLRTHCPCCLARRFCARIQARTRLLTCQELLGDGAEGTSIDEAPPDALGSSDLTPQHAVAGQRLRVGIIREFPLLDQAHRPRLGVRPGGQMGAGEATPPRRIGQAAHPVRAPLRQGNQAVTLSFFRAYLGSGLVIECLARSQLMPRRRSVCRIVSPLTWVDTLPAATLTSAASSNVHPLVGLPNARGQRCRSARSRSACSGPKSKDQMGALGAGRSLGQALQTGGIDGMPGIEDGLVVDAQGRGDAGGALPAGAGQEDLAKRIWQRRKTKASAERSPFSSAVRSSSLSGRTKRGGLRPTSLPLSRSPILDRH